MNQQSQQENKLSVKTWLLRKAGIYIDGILINVFTGLIFGGALWITQKFWGLRLIPFNVLDAILLALALAIVFVLCIALIVYLLISRFIHKHPEMATGIVLGLLFGTLVAVSMTKDGKSPSVAPEMQQSTPFQKE